MDNSFYRAFEEQHRGSRALIKSRLRTYIPFITPLVSSSSDLDQALPKAVDLGCGRGEWMELLVETGFNVRGVDLDQGMLTACHEQGLVVQKADALTTLQNLPDNSITLISALHLVEHMRFEEAQTLINQALRVLKPGGLLLMETPNPENIVVGASSFYLDPSHVRPIPPGLLSFMTEHAGFARHKVARLQEPKALHTTNTIGLFDVLNHVSPDYAVLAQKHASAEQFSALDALFHTNFGLSLDTLAQRYDQQIAQRFSALEQQFTHQFDQFETLLKQQEAKHTAINQQLHDILQSRSWRMTAPLRSAVAPFHRLKNDLRQDGCTPTIKRYLKQAIKRPLQRLIMWVLHRPKLQQAALRVLHYLPGIEDRLRNMMLRSGHAHNPEQAPPHTSTQLTQLTPRAEHILAELKQAMEIANNKKKKGKN